MSRDQEGGGGEDDSQCAIQLSHSIAKALRKKALPASAAHDDHSGGAHHGHGEKAPFILTAVASAIINFLLMFGLCCAYGIIMFEDHWNAKHRGLAVKMNICSAMIMGLLLASFSKVQVAIGGPDLNPVVFLGMFVQKIAEGVAEKHGLSVPSDERRLLETCSALVALDPVEALRRLGGAAKSTAEFCTGTHLLANGPECERYHEELRATTIFAVSVSSLIMAIIFFTLGRFRMTRFVTYVPAHIMEAFLACVGYKVFKYALLFTNYKPVQFIPAACVGVPLYFIKTMHLGNPAIVIPLVLFIPVGIFYAVVYSQGGTLETARASNWMFDELQNIEFWSVWTDGLGKATKINFKAWTKTFPDLAVMIIVVTLDAMLKLSSTESKLPVKPDKDLEVKLYGLGNFFTTACGSSVGYMQLKFNVINFGIVGNCKDRRAGAIYALLCGAIFFGTTDLFNYLPRFFLSTLLFFAGSGFVVENLWGSRKYLSPAEWLQILIIMAIFIFANSLLYAVVAGGLITGAMFIYRYSQIPCVIGRPMRGGEGRSLERRSFLDQSKVDHLSNSWTMIIQLKGFIFFASAQKMTGWVIQHIEKESQGGLPAYQRLRFIIFDCAHLDGLDSSASKAFAKLAVAAGKWQVHLLWSGLPEDTKGQLTSCGTIANAAQVHPNLEEARASVETQIERYIAGQQRKWIQLHPLFGLAHHMMLERMALEPFEEILRLDTARFGCPWKYCSRLRIRAFVTMLWRDGERRKTFFLVHRGKVGMFTTVPSALEGGDWEMPVAVHGRGQLLNCEALLGRNARLNAVALEDGELLSFGEEQWARMQRECPAMAVAISRIAMQQDDDAKPPPVKAKKSSERLSYNTLERGQEEDDGNGGSFLGPAEKLALHEDHFRPWMQGLHVAKGLAKLGLFDAPGAEGCLHTTPCMRERVETGLVLAFNTYALLPGSSCGDAKDESISAKDGAKDGIKEESNGAKDNTKDGSKDGAEDRTSGKGVVPAAKVGEALMYAGLFGGPVLTTGEVGDLDEASFVCLGQKAATARLSSRQAEKLRELFWEAADTMGGTLDSAGVTRLLRGSVHPGLSAVEAEDLLSLCGGAAVAGAGLETFQAMVARLVRRHEWDWCLLLGCRKLLGREEGSALGDVLTPQLLVQNGAGVSLGLEEAEELLWSADLCGCSDLGEVCLDLPSVALALWPGNVPPLPLPPAPSLRHQDAVPGCLNETTVQGLLLDLRDAAGDAADAGDAALAERPRLALERIAGHEWELDFNRKNSLETVESETPAKEYPKTRRAQLHLFLEYPDSSMAAARWSLVMGLLIVISVFTLVAEPLVSPSDEPEDPTEQAVWTNFERFFTAVFTLDFLLRLSVADALGDQTFLGFFKAPMNIADITAVLPFYIDLLIGTEAQEFRLLRLVRLMRVARLVLLGRLARRSSLVAPIAVIMVVIWFIFMKSSF